MSRAYSLLTVTKSLDEPDGLRITGMASTPTPDRVGDIVDPMGAKFKTPMPLILYHQAHMPVGNVTFAKPTKAGIPFEAFLPYIKELGTVKDRVDEAIHSIKYRLVGAVSIGFRAVAGAAEYLKGGGVHYKEWEWLELSLVTIPANQEATILTVKSLDLANGAAPGASTRSPVVIPSGVSGNLPPISQGFKMQTTETIRAMEAERAAKAASLSQLMDASSKEGRTLNVDEQKSYDDVSSEIKAIDAHVARLREFDSLTGTPVPTEQKSVRVGSDARGGVSITHQRSNDPAGIDVARIARCLWMAKGNAWGAAQIAEQVYKDAPAVARHLKATTVAGSTVSGTWAADLMTTDGGPFAAFLDYLRPMTILGKFGQNGVPSLNRVPFYAPVGIQTGAGAGYWVGEGKGKPVTSFDYDKTSLVPLTLANICVITKKLFKYSGISADTQIRDQLAQALIGRMDTDFIDPTKAVDAGISPASITNGVTAPNSAGNTADDVREDIRTLLAALSKPIRGLVFIMDTTTAMSLSLMVNGLGQREFPEMSMEGGRLAGASVIVSDYVPSVTAGSLLVAVKAGEILLADEGGFNIDMSEDASLEMRDDPTASSVATVTAASLVSMFQTNSVAFRVERDVNWAAARSGAVAVIDTVNYGAA
jgi:HK97 family phage major capsid protein